MPDSKRWEMWWQREDRMSEIEDKGGMREKEREEITHNIPHPSIHAKWDGKQSSVEEFRSSEIGESWVDNSFITLASFHTHYSCLSRSVTQSNTILLWWIDRTIDYSVYVTQNNTILLWWIDRIIDYSVYVTQSNTILLWWIDRTIDWETEHIQ